MKRRIQLSKARPIGYLVTLIDDYQPTDKTVLIQTDWEYPSLASTFGFVTCWCGETDGTENCPHRTAVEMITAAADFLREHIDAVAEDPGYFTEEEWAAPPSSHGQPS